jgi:hypothetical protein
MQYTPFRTLLQKRLRVYAMNSQRDRKYSLHPGRWKLAELLFGGQRIFVVYRKYLRVPGGGISASRPCSGGRIPLRTSRTAFYIGCISLCGRSAFHHRLQTLEYSKIWRLHTLTLCYINPCRTAACLPRLNGRASSQNDNSRPVQTRRIPVAQRVRYRAWAQSAGQCPAIEKHSNAGNDGLMFWHRMSRKEEMNVQVSVL